jgi:hypothetical protein
MTQGGTAVTISDMTHIPWRLGGPLTVVVAVALTPTVVFSQPKTVSLLNYTTTVPAGWTPRAPASSMRLAEYVVPGADGAVGAEVVVYFFGTGQGGSTEANLARWKGQFSNPDGGRVYERITHDSSAAAPLTVAEYRGTYARGVGPGSAPEAARPDNALVAVVAETPRGTLFFQLFGPVKAVEAARNAYLGFARGLK